jgi:hypothetical protein
VFGALPRLIQSWNRRDAVLLGLGIGIHCIARQFESMLLLACIILYATRLLRSRELLKKVPRVSVYAMAAAAPFFVLTLLQNKAVTQNWFTLPEQLSQYQYGVPTSLTFQPVPQPHVPLTPQQELDYRAQTLSHGLQPDSLSRFLLRLEFRVRYYRFFFFPALYLGVFAFLLALKERRLLYVVGALAIFALGTNLFPYLLPHYLSAVTCFFILIAIIGLERLSKLQVRKLAIGAGAAKILALICLAHFLMWYGCHLFENSAIAAALEPFETWDAINHGDPHGRNAVNRQLAAIPGKLLVLVQYSPRHIFQNEWVWNAADLDASRIIWARDLGATENTKLIAQYPNRQLLLLEPDLRPPKLERYSPE